MASYVLISILCACIQIGTSKIAFFFTMKCTSQVNMLSTSFHFEDDIQGKPSGCRPNSARTSSEAHNIRRGSQYKDLTP